jgi:menaquinone reductase, molybdopterin-binding-like subunit
MRFRENKVTRFLGMNRRNFIKLAVGGAIGTALSPLPWKLTDDIAIWTENLPWVPVPSTGEFTYAKSICTLCPGGCGIKVRKVDERAVKIEGRTDYPVNPGGLCPLGMGGLQLLYNERIRFTSPMKRTGARGTGPFQAISWEEAIDILAQRISDLKVKGNINALAVIDGKPRWSTTSVLIERLFNALGSPNYMRMQSFEDTAGTAAGLLTGRQGAVAYDLENADYILSFGSGLLEGWGTPGRVLNAWGLWRSGDRKSKVEVVQVESRASNTASKADRWIAAKPGTEAALALGICNIIISENLYDAGFINKYSFGFSDFKSADGINRKGFKTLVLEDYTPEKVARITGVDAEDIRELAKGFAKAKAPVAICGRGKGALYGSLYETMSVLCLNALVGGVNRTGGVFIHEPLPLGELPAVQTSVTTKTADKGRIDRAGTGGLYPFSNTLLNNFSDSVIKANESPVDTLLIFSANPVFTSPDCGTMQKAMEKIPFIASFSSYRDETALFADLILPDHTCLETMDDIPWPIGLQYPLYGLSAPVLKALYNTKNSGDAIIELAKKIGSPASDAFTWSNFEEVLKIRAKGLFDAAAGMTSYDGSKPPWTTSRTASAASPDYNDFDDMWKKLKKNGLWYQPASTQSLEDYFKTPSLKFEFYSSSIDSVLKVADLKTLGIKATGDDARMPHFEEIAYDTDIKSFPLKMQPYEHINLSSGRLPNPPYLNKTIFDDELSKDQSYVDIHPDTAKDYNLKQGDKVFIESPKGKLQVLANLSEGAMPGVVFMPLGLGHSAYDDFVSGKGVNPNEIIFGGKDPLSGQPVWWDTPVRLIKA